MRRFQGIILLTTIGMILFMTLMVISSMHALFLLKKMNQQLDGKHQLSRELEHAITYFVRHASTDSLTLCAQKTIKKEHCQVTQNQQTFDFEVFDLGIFPCLEIRENQVSYASHHWTVSAHNIQIRMATTALFSQCTALSKSLISQGILSWKRRSSNRAF